MENTELYKGLKEIAVKQLKELHQKGSMSAPEAEAAKTAMCIIDMCDEHVGMEETKDDGYSSRSYGHMPYRQYQITSYDDGRSMRGRGYSMHDDWYPADSYRGRSYAERERDSQGRYSSHSIDDRVVSMLESMVDSAKSDYEHQRLMEYIRYVRSKENGE